MLGPTGRMSLRQANVVELSKMAKERVAVVEIVAHGLRVVPIRSAQDRVKLLAIAERVECVALIKRVAPFLDAGTKWHWRRGRPVWIEQRGQRVADSRIVPGTPIAYGWDARGRYPSKRTGNHAAIYIGSMGAGRIRVYDQFTDRHGNFQPVAMRAKDYGGALYADLSVIERG